ncbi:hypothetical protein ACSVH2_08825 [Flavobacterium sp. RSB2_4_14]|uniref:hypothetical protein n=1 Tax=Flavobacterium sp. RSB2_4_14 TaxID=3447665 RepID=UPI003F2A08B1
MEIKIDEKTKEVTLIDIDTYVFKNLVSEHSPEENVGLESISFDDEITRIDFVYVATQKFGNGSWVQIERNSFIRPVGSDVKYKLIKAINIPYAPSKHFLKCAGQVLRYTLLFPALPKNTKEIDIIEKLAPGYYFNFFRVQLNNKKPLLVSFGNDLN